jgi:hypothetical protein
VLHVSKPIVRVGYSVGSQTAADLEDIVDSFLKKHKLL